jgi:phosphoribosyl-ATP pyrophosphohydrolase/phosphoribosyl-AMP cyclohydrolase
MLDLSALNLEKGGGTVTVVAQDAGSGTVLMVANADREALERTIATGEMHYRSRTRGLWHKGATSGNVQRVVSLAVDCDGDAVLARVEPMGPACHTGMVSCFGETALGSDAIGVLARTIGNRAREVEHGPTPSSGGLDHQSKMSPSSTSSRSSYTQRLLADRNLRLKKLGEEAAELVTACADGDAARVTEEAADLAYHMLVAMRACGVSLGDLQRTLAARAAR